MDGSIKLENSLAELERLESWVAEIARSADLNRRKAFSLRLALEEIVSNVMKYAYKADACCPVDIRCSRRDDFLDVFIEDSGPLFNPLEFETPEFKDDIDQVDEGGLGIHLVRAMMDSVAYHRKGDKNVLRLGLKIKDA